MVKVKGWKAFYSSTNFFLAATLEADQSSLLFEQSRYFNAGAKKI